MKNIISPLKFSSIVLISLFFSTCSNNSSTKITEQQWSIKTYPFNNPNPIPITLTLSILLRITMNDPNPNITKCGF